MDDMDAVIAAPDSHKVILENDKVRILEVVILPGQKEPIHTHDRSSVMIVDSSTNIKYYTESGEGTEYPEREATKEKPFIEWLGPEGLHAVENLDQSKTYRAIRVEIKTEI